MTKTCIICGKGFDPKRKCGGGKVGVKTCSKSCSLRARRARIKKYLHDYHAKKHPPKMIGCKICGKIFAKKAFSLCCSLSCSKKNRLAIQSKWQIRNHKKPVKHFLNCRFCGVGFLSTKGQSVCGDSSCRKKLASEQYEKEKNTDNYISKYILRVPTEICPPQLIAAKRAQIQLKRLVKQMKSK